MAKELPILFSTEMVQAILAGRKIQTRRVINPQPIKLGDVYTDASQCYRKEGAILYWQDGAQTKCKWQPGDMLWVREAFRLNECWDDTAPHFGDNIIDYKASPDICPECYVGNWKPSIHLPKTQSRIWLEVESVNVEQLHDITESDAMCEGVKEPLTNMHPALKQFKTREPNYRTAFAKLWFEINGVDSWKSNPWVWIIKFKVLSTTGRPETTVKEAAEA